MQLSHEEKEFLTLFTSPWACWMVSLRNKLPTTISPTLLLKLILIATDMCGILNRNALITLLSLYPSVWLPLQIRLVAGK